MTVRFNWLHLESHRLPSLSAHGDSEAKTYLSGFEVHLSVFMGFLEEQFKPMCEKSVESDPISPMDVQCGKAGSGHKPWSHRVRIVRALLSHLVVSLFNHLIGSNFSLNPVNRSPQPIALGIW